MSAARFTLAALGPGESLTSPDTCECCGREYLKKTVKVTDGVAVMWMGVGCAAKACGVGIREARKAHKVLEDARAVAARAIRDEAHRAHMARWTAHLDARCPALKGDTFRQIEALGGYYAAHVGFDR